MISLHPVTPDNWRSGLKVAPEQEKYVANAAVLLARAYAYREHGGHAFIIYNDDTPIGMTFYCDWFNEEGQGFYNFCQFFIDARYQRQGFGTKAAEMILDLMREDGRFEKVTLCYIEGNDEARRLYEKLGFTHTGDSDGDEIIMEKRL